ncbi:glucokinase [Mariprofundus ferrinatatus]|uniref:Glucokinase n=1 Tax=Mariprofundus ferrinatatus TaxID=1921087 RepID=A0A2K8L2T8_9PROT|nr:ROK family protein [Mariprofundus ferrinatatus]ATX81650.1 glucokinase [Mariprofundus ferrinatatus]
MTRVLAADIGGTNLRLAVVSENGTILEEGRFEARLSSHGQTSQKEAQTCVIQTLSKAIIPFMEQHPTPAIGIGFPGFFHGNSGVLAASPNLPLLEDFALAERLSEQLGMHVAVQNDALCAAIGEQRFGAGKGKTNLLHITLGTGVGGGLILNDSPYTGEHGMAMEFGHLRVVTKHGRECGCGNSGCLEAYASATAVADRFYLASGIKADARQVFKLACDGNKEAVSILAEAGSYLGQAIAESVKLLDLESVTISGGLSHAWEFIHPSLMNTLNENLIPPLRGKVKVLPSSLNDNAGLLGAAVIASIN